MTIGKVSAAAGQAAYDCLCTAIDRTLAGQADGIVILRRCTRKACGRRGCTIPGTRKFLRMHGDAELRHAALQPGVGRGAACDAAHAPCYVFLSVAGDRARQDSAAGSHAAAVAGQKTEAGRGGALYRMRVMAACSAMRRKLHSPGGGSSGGRRDHGVGTLALRYAVRSGSTR